MKHFLLASILIFSVHSFSQSILNYNDAPITVVIKDVSNKFSVEINYNQKQLDGFIFSGIINENNVGEALNKIVANKGLAFIEYNKAFYIIEINSISKDLAEIININNSSSNKLLSDLYIIPKFIYSGQIIDSQSNEPITGIAIRDSENAFGVTSDYNGNFKLELPIGKHNIIYTGVGFETIDKELNIQNNLYESIEMFEESRYIDEVVISGNSIEQITENNQSGIEVMKIESISKLPTFMGEIDVIKSISSLPGISSVGEGASGFNVRGGSTDQNLILLDNITLYNSSHLFGFFSIFNSDVISNFSIYKGGIPSKFSGRASSILDVSTKNGELNKHMLSGTIGLISNKIKIEGPILKDKVSYLLTGRLAHPTWLFKYIPNKEIKKSSASFSDVNLKIYSELNNDTRLSWSSIYATDKFSFSLDTTYQWSTIGTSLKLEKNKGNRSYVLVGTVSNYENSIQGNRLNFEYNYLTSVFNAGLKGSFSYYLNDNDFIEIGIDSKYHEINSGKIAPTSATSTINDFSLEEDNAIESGIYVSIEKELLHNLAITVGTRYSYFTNIGPHNVYNYADESYPTKRNRIDSTNYTSGQFYGNSGGLEPRANIKYQISNSSSIKLGYNRMRQYMHLISNSTAVAPSDFWKLSNAYLSPIVSDQASIGYYQFFRKYALSVEAYYKNMDNIIDYRSGTSLFLNQEIETAVLFAKGRAYGIESKIEKRGKLNGWISYTYSRTEKKLQDNPNYNNGFPKEYYPTNFDKPHNLNVSMNYEITKRLDISTNFVFMSGRPITSPSSAYFLNERLVIDYNQLNNIRTENYHRLDLSLILETNLKKNKKFTGSWVFSVYNIYGRKNPFSIYFNSTENGKFPQAYQLSILGNAFPSLSYTFKLK